MSPSTPSIRIYNQPCHSSPTSFHLTTASPPTIAAATAPMAISRPQPVPPPPLPPPSYIPDMVAGLDPGWQWGNDPYRADFGRRASVRPGSSLLGGAPVAARSGKELDVKTYDGLDNVRRGSSMSTITMGQEHNTPLDNTTSSDTDGRSSRSPSNYRLQSEKRLEQRTLVESSHTYDKHLLSRIGGPNAPNRHSVSHSRGSLDISLPTLADDERRPSQLHRLSVPEVGSTMLESPGSSRWPQSSAVSPGFTGFWAEPNLAESRRVSDTRRSSLTFDDSVSHRASYDQSMYADGMSMDENRIGNLNIRDGSPGSDSLKTGVKRRASSPAPDGVRDELPWSSSASGQSEIIHRRSMQQMSKRSSPNSRFHPSHSSVSSVSSPGPRHGSLGSSLGISSIPSSATSYGSGRLSPSGLSPAIDPELRQGPPYSYAKPTTSSHQQTNLQGPENDTRSPPDDQTDSQHSSLSQSQGAFICECCPKKPRKFDTEEELRVHGSEKQYTCAYCTNRFKNKNEAERHQNSLHLRKHSWSCTALSGVESAFHASASASGTDTCGFCGEEFSNPPQWDVRAEHLSHVHKFGECNQSKKFFRADHFRQHLKHSHAGTSGKWTNTLENTCMKDEPPPEKRVSLGSGSSPRRQGPPTLMVSTTGLDGALRQSTLLNREGVHDD